MKKKNIIVLGGVLLAGVILVFALATFSGNNREVATGHYVSENGVWWDYIYFENGKITVGKDYGGGSGGTSTYDYTLDSKGNITLDNGISYLLTGELSPIPPQNWEDWVINIIDDDTFEIGVKGGIKFKYIRYQY